MPQSAKKLDDSSLRQRAASNLTGLRDRIEYLGGIAAPGEPLESLTHAATASQRAAEHARDLDLLSFERLALALEGFFSAYCNAGVVPNANVRSILLNAADVLARLDVDDTASMEAEELCDEIEQKTPKVELGDPRAPLPFVPDRAAPQLLVVDDSRAFTMLTNGILASRGYRVRNACNGVEALELLARADFDGVVTDVRMPLMDGIELLGRIRESRPWKELPVFFVTSEDLPEQAEAAIAAGADGYVLKNRTHYGSSLLDLLERELG